MKYFVIICTTILALFSCSIENSQEQILDDFCQKRKAIVFIPLNGCGTCIEKTLLWAKENMTNSHIGFVIIGNQRNKIIAETFGDKYSTYPNT